MHTLEGLICSGLWLINFTFNFFQICLKKTPQVYSEGSYVMYPYTEKYFQIETVGKSEEEFCPIAGQGLVCAGPATSRFLACWCRYMVQIMVVMEIYSVFTHF